VLFRSASTFTGGALNVEGGILKLTGAATIVPTSVTMYGGATLDYAQATAYGTDTGSPMSLSRLTVDTSRGVAGTAAIIKGNLTMGSAGRGSLTYSIPTAVSDGATLLSVTGAATVRNTDISLQFVNGSSSLTEKNARLILIDVDGTADYGSLTDASNLSLTSNDGKTYVLQVEDNDLLAVLDGEAPAAEVPAGDSQRAPLQERAKAYAEARLASVAMMNQGQDLVAGQGMASVRSATAGKGMRIGAFGGVDAGSSEYTTGSSVSVGTQTLMAGIGIGGDTGFGRVSLGGFFETGWGTYDTKNDVSGGSVKGSGNASFYGGGIRARLDTEMGLYIEASVRAGQTTMDFSGNVPEDGSKSKIDTTAAYYGGHGGIGYVFRIGGKNGALTLDLSAKAMLSHAEAQSVEAGGDSLAFGETDSMRARVGGRVAYAFGKQFAAYGGVYWEREFGGEQKLTVNGQSVKAPNMGGDTGIGEVGVSLQPLEDTPLFVDVAVQAYMGQRTGYGGNAQVRLDY
jgi:outer membrane autotransporter protein